MVKAIWAEHKIEFNEGTSLKHIASKVEDKCDSASQTTDTTIFPKGTTVVLGDSMINQC